MAETTQQRGAEQQHGQQGGQQHGDKGGEQHRGGVASDRMQQHVGQLREDASSAGREMKNRAVELGQDVRALASSAGEAAMEQIDPILDYVRQYPIRALLIAGGVGAVMGMLMKR